MISSEGLHALFVGVLPLRVPGRVAAEQKGEVARRVRDTVLVHFARRLRGLTAWAVLVVLEKERMAWAFAGVRHQPRRQVET